MGIDSELQKHYALLLGSASVSQACGLLGIGWDTAQESMRRCVERGSNRRQLERLKHLGVDEKSFGRVQSYITRLTDLENRITNAVTAGLNSKIQSLESAARGFWNFANYRVGILFFRRKLNLHQL